MQPHYQPKNVESQAQSHWQKTKQHETQEQIDKVPFYCLSMWPYPSGTLHMGHVRNYTIGDAIARMMRMKGHNVLQPIGWDAFGLPAENAAIQQKKSPAKWTYENIEAMTKQFISLGLAYDWNREITTCKPDYYKWNQWLFLQMYKRGLAYQKTSAVNWDPVDNTVLANEQVVNGKGWRSGAPVERRMLKQWFFRINAYAESLLKELDNLPGWPEQVKRMQRNWIGKQTGTTVRFALKGTSEQSLEVFTTRADTLFGVPFLVIAPEHPLAQQAGKTDEKIQNFIQSCASMKTSEAEMATMDKKGIATPYLAIHPLNGEELPIWIGNFVLMEYGTGAVMAVPAHDERDHAFAKKYDLPILPVMQADDDAFSYQENAWIGEGPLIASGEYNGLVGDKAKEAILEALAAKDMGSAKTTYRLRDWGISRQRYWGTPIPIIQCKTCGTVPVPEEDLPVVLPEDLIPSEGNALDEDERFWKTTCPICHKPARRETDTMDTFVDSSWYFLRYTCPDQTHTILDDRVHYWAPVNQYIGGIEHATMHLLYARFMCKVLQDLKCTKTSEPFTNLLTQGMVLNKGQKMSKSKGNTVSPIEMIEQYGADTTRLFILFAAPPHQSMEWNQGGIDGAHRFLNKLWACVHQWQPLLSNQNTDRDHSKERRALHSHLQQALNDYEKQQFNTVVSACMKMVALIQEVVVEKENAPFAKEAITKVLKLLAPITPHIADGLWRELKLGESVFDGPWPKVDSNALVCDQVEWIVQINGKMRGSIKGPLDADEKTLIALCKEDTKLMTYLADKAIVKVIVVPNKLVNIVL